MTTKKKPDLHWVHHQAGLACQFAWQDQDMEEYGSLRILSTTAIVGKIKGTENYLVCCEGIATDGAAQGEYWWPIENYLVVFKQENGEPISRDATDEEIALFEGEDA